MPYASLDFSITPSADGLRFSTLAGGRDLPDSGSCGSANDRIIVVP